MHSNIPPPHVLGQAFMTSTRPPPVLESNNRYSILPIEDTNNLSVETDEQIVRAPPKLTKRPASNSLRAKASNKKMTTISSPILMTMHQSRPPLEEFQAAVMNAQLDGAEQAPSVNSDEAALLVGKVPPQGSSHTASSEGVARGGETSPGTERNTRTSKFKSPSNAEASTKAFISRDQSRGLHPQKHELLTTEGRLGTPNETQDPMEAQASYEGWGVSDRAGKSVLMAQVESSISARISGQDQDDTPRECTAGSLPVAGKDAKKTQYSAGTCARQTTEERTAEWEEAASAQAVKRGHTVTMIEVPDPDDDTAYRQWLGKRSPVASPKRCASALPTPPDSPTNPTKTPHWDSRCTDIISPKGPPTSPSPNEGVGPTYVRKHEVTSPTVATPSAASAKVREAPLYWMRPFEVNWTLHAVCEARNNNTTHAALAVWIHKDKGTEMTDKLLTELRLGGENARERLYKLRNPPVIVHSQESSKNNFLVDIILNPITGTKTLSTKGLLDSGCTSSAINQSFIKKHHLETHKINVPIPVYNADGTRNASGDITEYIETRMTIKGHVEHIDLTVTNLGKKDIYLGHDWLKRHNPSVNWKTQSILFGRCSCTGNTFSLPDSDPNDKWDEELEEGDTIIAVRMEEELIIWAVHHANNLAAATNAEKPKKSFAEMVPEHYHSFCDLFSKENFDELPERKPWDHAIELTPNAKLTLDCKVYPLNRNKQEQLDMFLDENLESGRIRPSKSPFTSPFFFIKKKDGTLQPVQDYRKLNKMMIKNRYPLPLILELINKLRGAKDFTKLDVRWGYNNVRIKEGDEEKAAFHTNQGLFKPTVMFFGLTNSPATFQWMMNDIFRDLIGEGKVTIYLDDILIFSKDLGEHRQIVKRVLQRLRENKLFLKAEKCKFEVLEIEYLGVIISENLICMEPVKITRIAKWPTPMKKRELQSFLGFTNFYRKFIKNYSKVVKALTTLTGLAPWKWGSEDRAFAELKKRMAEDVILAIPNKTDPFMVKADASEGAIGAVLSQKQNGKWHPVAFMSKSLSVTECNYEIYNKELLAIMLALDEWRHYLMGATIDVEIWTDHQNLQYFRKPQKLNRWQARWVTELAEYHFVLHHKPGALNKKADLLSHRDDHNQGKDNNGDIVVLQPAHFRALIMPMTNEVHTKVEEATRQEELWMRG